MDRGAWWATVGLQESDTTYQQSRPHHQTFATPHDLATTVYCNFYLHFTPYIALGATQAAVQLTPFVIPAPMPP